MQFLYWFIGAMVLGAVEIFTLDLTFAMLAGGAIAGGVVALLGGPWWLAMFVAIGVSALLLFGLRPFLLRSLRLKGEAEPQTNAKALVGRAARTIDSVSESGGRVKLNGEVWSARTEEDAPSIPEGAEVRVVRIEGATAIVEPESEA
ncbi:NfeD family protein [Demequina sp. SYSU T00039]|uniref:NfeD family protein n=1 Tax=Demequina lignilytica TaxID=3051663 RepID=A0AAW7M2W6_9MICO|nr:MULTISPECIES: NfeD family protein [unclassified Demequina]MDN4479062.1 NfeD family protein [Demequina sp. SYSU T00039-1]MDN4489019.1 NfeD family protein [Demequina sp. SYSU T00039]MDN4491270.1 NfeD family protein [Demequina sp. SYSU T00068]